MAINIIKQCLLNDKNMKINMFSAKSEDSAVCIETVIDYKRSAFGQQVQNIVALLIVTFPWVIILTAYLYIWNLVHYYLLIMELFFLLVFVFKIQTTLMKEKVVVILEEGIQVTKQFLSGKEMTNFYCYDTIQDVVIHEGVKSHHIVTFLALLVKVENKKSQLQMMFSKQIPSIVLLKIYSNIQSIIKPVKSD